MVSVAGRLAPVQPGLEIGGHAVVGCSASKVIDPGYNPASRARSSVDQSI
jgi:hypothetical protein